MVAHVDRDQRDYEHDGKLLKALSKHFVFSLSKLFAGKARSLVWWTRDHFPHP
jgi:hypothetical protein